MVKQHYGMQQQPLKLYDRLSKNVGEILYAKNVNFPSSVELQ